MMNFGRLPGVFVATGIALVTSACLFSSSSSDDSGYGGCRTDAECPEASQPCRENRCVAGVCTEGDVPAGINSGRSQTDLVCHRLVCDGKGAEQSIVDVTVVHDTPHDCKQTSCTADGNPAFTPSAGDVPDDKAGDCKKPTCTTDGLPSTANDDNDPPPPSDCASYTCANGTTKGTPIHQGKVCAPTGFSCGASGKCDTCPAPDARCTDPGPGKNARSPSTAYHWGDIGRCDSGGRTFCGVLAAGQTAYFRFRDDGTGALCQLDPHIEVSPTAEVSLCVGSQCTTTGALSFSSSSGQEITFSVTAKTACTGYTLSFHL